MSYHERGEWEFSSKEDPITDEVIYKVCKNPNERIKDDGSNSLLCIEYNQTINKLSAYIKDTGTYHDETTYEIIRFGKDRPVEKNLELDKSSSDFTKFILNPLILLDEIKAGKRFVIRIENYQGSKGKRETYVYEASTPLFMKAAKPILEATSRDSK